MSKPKFRWWSFVKAMIRDYPNLEKAWKDVHQTSITANYSAMPKGGSASRTVENISLRQMDPDDQKVYDAVSRAIELTRLLPDGKRRMDMIRLTYWVKKPMTLKSAALHLFISECTAKRWHGSFVRCVAVCYGFQVDTPEPK